MPARTVIAPLLLLAGSLAIADPAPGDAQTAMLAPIVVSGEQPGPGLWKVTSGERVLWILGTLAPLPKKMTWISREVEETIAQSQEVIMSPGVGIGVEGGAVAGVFLLPSLLKARNNPDRQQLGDVVPADLYARWLVLKQKYLGRDAGVEKRRPIFAALELYAKAIDSAGLTDTSITDPVLRRGAKKHRVTVTRPMIHLKLAKARASVKEFAKTGLDDIDCLRKTIERLESDLLVMQARANAWAIGDLGAFADLPYVDQNRACRDALLHSAVAQERGLDDLPERIVGAWLEAVEKALQTNDSTLAVLPVGILLDDARVLAPLRARGYTVEAPE